MAIHPQAERRQPCKSLSSPPKSQEVGNRRRSCEWITLNFRIRRKSIFPAFINNIHNQIFPFSPPPPTPFYAFSSFPFFLAIFWVLSLLAGAFCHFPTALFASRYLFSLLSRHDGIMIGSCLLVKGIFFPFREKKDILKKGSFFVWEFGLGKRIQSKWMNGKVRIFVIFYVCVKNALCGLSITMDLINGVILFECYAFSNSDKNSCTLKRVKLDGLPFSCSF